MPKCRKCNGKKVVAIYCEYCEGTGHRDCENCNYGWCNNSIGYTTKIDPCPECNGYYDEAMCNYCRGEGEYYEICDRCS